MTLLKYTFEYYKYIFITYTKAPFIKTQFIIFYLNYSFNTSNQKNISNTNCPKNTRRANNWQIIKIILNIIIFHSIIAMIPNKTTLKRFIKAKMNFFVYGPRASGKTHLLKQIFDEVNIQCIYINCTMGDKKTNFFKYLNHQLDKFFKKSIKEKLAVQKTLYLKYQTPEFQPTSVHHWIQYIKKLSPQLKQLLKQIYFFIDNIQEINVSTNFMTTFFCACQQNMIDNLKIPFVFCGITLPRKIYAVDKPFRNITSFCMKKPLQLMQHVIQQDIIESFKNQFKKDKEKEKDAKTFQLQDIESASKYLAITVYHAFQPMQTDLNRIKKMTRVLANKIAESVLSQISEEIERNKLQKKSLHKRIQSKNNKGQIKTYTRQMLQQGPIDNFLMQRNANKQKLNQQATVELPYQFYPNLILSSLYLADQAPQCDDKRRFQDYKKQKGKMSKHIENRMGKHNLQRIIAISEVLQSVGKQDGPQAKLQHHSINYYACFQFLRQQNKILHSGKNLNFASHKIHGDTKSQQASTFLKTKLDAYIGEYIPKA